MKRLFVSALCAAACMASAAHASRSTLNYTSLTVFGDSLVDAGNLFILTDGAIPPASLGYFEGRFTNGYDFTDLLSLDLFGTPTTASLAGGTNFAFGLARATTTSIVPDLAEQFAAHQAWLSGGHMVDANGLYVMTFGANDIFNLPDGYPSNDDALRAAAHNIAAGVQSLNDIGVRNILLTDFPLGGAHLADSLAANAYLTAELAGLSLDADTTLMRFGMLDFLGRVLTDPDSFGLPPISPISDCITDNAQATGCVGYLYFDGTHPTAAIQAAAYRDMDRQFGLFTAVPEPASWMMLIAGFALTGTVLRTRSRRIAFA